MSNSSSARGPAYLLKLFKGFKPYAWAPAYLANLYRMLAKAVQWVRDKEEGGDEGKKKNQLGSKKFRTLSGPLQLLQVIYFNSS